MIYTYYLEFLGEEIELLQSPQIIGREDEFIDLLIPKESRKRLHLIEIKIVLLFDELDTINHRSYNWRDNLKTLLAHGFILRRGPDVLRKSYRPLKFGLLPAGDSKAIHFGFFHRTDGDSLSGQFIKFCKQTEYPQGIHQHVISTVLENNGGSLCAYEGFECNLLMKRDPQTGILAGDAEILHFIFNMAF